MRHALLNILGVELGKGEAVGSGPMNVALGVRIQRGLWIQLEKSADS
jgi:hypothetical protein